MTVLDYVILALTLSLVLFMGGLFFKEQTSLREYFLGSRNIPWWAAAFSGIATMTSAVSYLGAPGQAFKSNYTFLQYRLALPIAIGVICFALIPYFHRLQVFTAYEYLERRFDRKTRLLASTLFLFLKLAYLAIVIYAPSLIVAQMTGLSPVWIIPAIGLLTSAYTLMGGMRAVIWTDSFQLFILMGGLVVAAWWIIGGVEGGLSGVLQSAGQQGKLDFFDLSFRWGGDVTFWGGLLGGTFYMVSQYGVDQAELQRFLTVRSLRRTQLAVVSAMLLGTVLGFFQFFIGTALYVFYTQLPDKAGLAVSPDRVFPKFIIEELPAGVTGLLMAGVFAAAMSTISSVLNSMTTVAMNDFSRGRDSSVRAARLVTLGFGLLATGAAFGAGRLGTILELSAAVTNFFGGSLVGIFLLGIWTRRAHGWGAFLGALAGFTGVVLLSLLTSVSWIWYSVFSASVAFGSGWIISRLLPALGPTGAGGMIGERP